MKMIMNVDILVLKLLDRIATYLLPHITLTPSQNNFILWLKRFSLGLSMPVLPALKR